MRLREIRIQFEILPYFFYCPVVLARVIEPSPQERADDERQWLQLLGPLVLCGGLAQSINRLEVSAIPLVGHSLARVQLDGPLVLAPCACPIPVIAHLDKCQGG